MAPLPLHDLNKRPTPSSRLQWDERGSRALAALQGRALDHSHLLGEAALPEAGPAPTAVD